MPASALMNVMVAAARKAGRSLARDFGEVEALQVSLKGPANFVSAADHRAEDILFTELSRARPGYGLLMEERGEIKGADATHRWIVDPLDGTTNFLHSIPLFAVSIALERDGHGEEGNGVQEVGGAVERVDDPAMGRVGALDLAALLHEQAVAGTRAGKLGEENVLGAVVGGADEIGRTFERDLQGFHLAEVAREAAARLAGGGDHDVHQR